MLSCGKMFAHLAELICITVGDSDRRRRLRVEELVVFVLRFFRLGRLGHGWQVYSFSGLAWS